MAAKDNKLRTTLKKSEKKSVLDTTIHRSQVQKKIPFIKEDILPPGKYVTKITAVSEAVTENSKPAVDLYYEFTNQKGEVVEAKERYIISGYYFEKLGDALIDAGLPDGAVISEAVGLKERVTVTYPRKGYIGRIQHRSPNISKTVTPPTSVTAEEYEEDMLVEEEDEDDEFDFELDDE